jgi:hypothetical protein
MNFLLLGVVSGLDVLVNVFVFSGVLRAEFDVAEAARFSTVLAWSVILSAVMFGGAEQAIDHRRQIPQNFLASPRTSATLVFLACGVLYVVRPSNVPIDVAATILLAGVGGLRSICRAVAYARERYILEATISLIELSLIVAFTVMSLSILAAYLCSRLIGLALRIPVLVRFPSARQTQLDMWSYSFSAIAPALYFNIYYAALPSLVSPEVLVRFRLIQSALVPMSFLGSLVARARIVLRGGFNGLLRFFDHPEWIHGRRREFAIWIALPAAIASVYICILAVAIVPLKPLEIAWTVLYCAFIYHRAQLYSLLTLKVGPFSRARIALLGILLIAASLLPIAVLESPTVSILYAALTSVEAVLLALSVLTLYRRREGVSA